MLSDSLLSLSLSLFLGWHQCKYGWKSLSEVETVVSTYKQHQIPLETIWGDIGLFALPAALCLSLSLSLSLPCSAALLLRWESVADIFFLLSRLLFFVRFFLDYMDKYEDFTWVRFARRHTYRKLKAI